MQPVLFSVSYAGLWGQAKLPLEEFIPHARELGYSAVALMGKRPHLSPLDWPADRLGALADLCRKSGVRVACVAAYTNFLGGAEAPEVPFGDMQVQYVESLAQMAHSLDCSLVRVFTAYERDDMPPAEQWNRTALAIRQCCDRCARYGVTLGIQNHHDLAVHSKSLLEFLRDVDRPNCKLAFDPWSLCVRGEEPFETARRMAPHVVYTTFADYLRLPRARYRPGLVNYDTSVKDLLRAVPMGEGDLDNASFLRGLRAGGYDGFIAYELCSPLRGGGATDNLDSCARGFLQWLRENQH